ncbi:MAG: AMP-binding protein [Candidatus Lokiarchaeota archaeon]|nr:AMP-binding protein [Candidatus Lokiarchaeota archaeon]MBD3338877.1 AMP-binding protein [Candidatus Lokiarchaeota archaeon]
MSDLTDQKRYYKFWPDGVPKNIEIPDKTLVDFLEDSVQKYPDKPVTYFMGFELTYTQLNDIVDRVATKLTELGMKKGDCIAIQFTNNPAFITSYYGILKMGGVVTSISPLFKSLEIRRQLIDSEARVYIGWEGFSGLVDPIIEDTKVEHKFYSNLAPYLTPDPMAPPEFEMGGEPPFETLLRETKPNPPKVDISVDDLAMLQYTGGTTGFPKGAMLTHGSIAANVYQANAWFVENEEANEVILAALPFYHIYMAFFMNFTIKNSSKLACVFNPREAHEVIEVIEATQATIVPGVAALYNNMNNYEDIKNHDLSCIKYCFSSAGPLPEDIRVKFESLTGAKLREAYGLTEMSPACIANPFDDDKFKPGTIGIPFPNTEAKILDADGNVLKINEVGELVVRGPQMMEGYYKREEETKNTIKDGWLWTGDLALMDDDGYFVIKDRAKNLIKYKGHSVYPTEVEDLLYNFEPINECAVIGIIDDEGKENIKAYISLKEEYKGKVSGEDIIEWAKNNMGFDKYPRFIEFIDEIPKTIVGKVLHRELRDKEQDKKK